MIDERAIVPPEIVFSTRVDLVGLFAGARSIVDWARESSGRMVCATNVHMVVEARDDPSFAAVVHDADRLVADGRPASWACGLLDRRRADHVRGQDLTARLCELAARKHLSVGLWGVSRTRFSRCWWAWASPSRKAGWATHRDRLTCTMVGVGAVFDMLAGLHRVAPAWLQGAGWSGRSGSMGSMCQHNARSALCFGAQWARF